MAEKEEICIIARLGRAYSIITSSNAPSVEGVAVEFCRDMFRVIEEFGDGLYELTLDELVAVDYWSKDLMNNVKLSKNMRKTIRMENEAFNKFLDEIGLSLDDYILAC